MQLYYTEWHLRVFSATAQPYFCYTSETLDQLNYFRCQTELMHYLQCFYVFLRRILFKIFFWIPYFPQSRTRENSRTIKVEVYSAVQSLMTNTINWDLKIEANENGYHFVASVNVADDRLEIKSSLSYSTPKEAADNAQEIIQEFKQTEDL